MRLTNQLVLIILIALLYGCNDSNKEKSDSLKKVPAQKIVSVESKNLTFESEGINLAGTIYMPKQR